MKFCRFLILLLFLAKPEVARAEEAAKLAFSPDLMESLEKCLPYQENLSGLNPEISSFFSPALKNVPMQIIMSVNGRDEKNLCQISFEQKILNMGTSLAECNITDEQREALLIAMKDTSKNQYTDTFEIQKGTLGKNGKPVQMTLTGDLLYIVYHKILNTSCVYNKPAAEKAAAITDLEMPDADKTAPDIEENQEEEDVQYDVFTPAFMKSWQVCKADKAEYNDENDKTQTVEIIGMDNRVCHVKFADFDLRIPADILSNIHSFSDLTALLKNKDIAKYDHQPDYIYDGLIYALDMCSQKRDYNGVEETSQNDNITFTKGMYAEYMNQQCVIYLQNEIDIDGSITDYGVRCFLSDKVIKELEPYFKDLIEKYGRKRMFTENGQVQIRKAEFNEETHKGDLALMFYLQQNGYCKHNKEQ